MDSRDVLRKGPKPAAEVAEGLRNREEPEEPISERVSHLTPRGEEFKNPQNPEVVESPIQAEPEPEALTVEEMLVMEDAELASYGIDDPKTWKAYQRLLHKKEAEWIKKENNFERTISDLQRDSGRREQSIQEPVKSLPDTPLTKPIKPLPPANYDVTEALTDPNSASAQHMKNMDAYRTAYDVYQVDKDTRQDALIEKLTGYVTKEQEIKLQERRREEVKSKSLSRFQTRGLSAKDATALYDTIEQAYMSDAETGADIFVNLFKNGSNGSNLQNPTSKDGGGRRKLPENVFLPPGVNSSTGKPEASKSKTFMNSIAGANQSRKIILDRRKK